MDRRPRQAAQAQWCPGAAAPVPLARLPAGIVFAALGTGSWAIAAAIWFPDADHWPIRTLLFGVVVTFFFDVLRRRDRRVLLSPAALLPAIALVFFSVLPAFYMALGIPIEPMREAIRGASARYLHSTGELIVLQFAAFALAIAAAMHGWLQPSGRDRSLVPHRAGILATAVLAVLVLVKSGVSTVPFLAQWAAAGIGRQIVDGVPPAVSICATILTWCAAHDSRWRWPALTAIAGAAVALLLTSAMSKSSAFIVVSCLLLYAILRRATVTKLVLFGVAGIAVLSLLAIAVIEIRLGNVISELRAPDRNPAAVLLRPVIGKAVVRQAETAGCFQNVVDQHLNRPGSRSPLGFLVGLVPRFLWPEKPNLSRGASDALTYCHMQPGLAGGPVHSASITLLGEPIAESGLVGLLVAESFLLILLAGATFAVLRGGAVGAVAVTALLPWLADFDQSMALYVANAAKMFLYMLPILIVAVFASTQAEVPTRQPISQA